jgi:threonylcarbamoyladenosine tRNA methylthiotransferase MtaB
VAVGCYVQRARDVLENMDEVDLVIDNGAKEHTLDVLCSSVAGFERAQPARSAGKPSSRTRSFVKIQEGCDQKCTFCIVPSVRGSERSRPQKDVISEVVSRVGEGYKEIVLTGTRIGRYSRNGGLSGLVRSILREVDLPRLRLSSLEPGDVTPDLLRLWEDGRLCPHIHMSLQSGSDMVLDRMGRGYSTEQYKMAVDLAREAVPDLALTTDVIVGFPGESEAQFEETRDFCQRMRFARMHVFPYSPRHGTAAAVYSYQLAAKEIRKRSQILLRLACESAREFRGSFVGRRSRVLLEERSGTLWSGLTDNYLRVYLASREPLANSVREVDLVGVHDGGLKGQLTTRLQGS